MGVKKVTEDGWSAAEDKSLYIRGSYFEAVAPVYGTVCFYCGGTLSCSLIFATCHYFELQCVQQ